MKTVTLRIERQGGKKGVLEQGRRYLSIAGTGDSRPFDMPIGHEDCLNDLGQLRYEPQGDDPQKQKNRRQESLSRLSLSIQQILKTQELPVDTLPLHIDLVTSFQELWVLPFEAVLDSHGQPLFAQQDKPVVLTRRIPTDTEDDHPFQWPARPRVLFVHASPDWIDAPDVPSSAHREALQTALRPWFDPIDDPNMVLGDERTVLTELKDATLKDICDACQQAADEGRPYTHVHLLAHGSQSAAGAAGSNYGIALCSPDEQATKPEAFVHALKPVPKPEMQKYNTPAVVTLAACDSANMTTSFLEIGSVAQELHRAGIPVVVASQLPLTFPGSEIMTRQFYQMWMRGNDVRIALQKTRVALFQSEQAGHDWLSLVSYVSLPHEYNDYLLELRLQSQLCALETTSNHAKKLLEREIDAAWQYDLVTKSLQDRIDILYQYLQDNQSAGQRPMIEVFQENTGLLGSAHKRLAELYTNRADTDPPQREAWLKKSRLALDKACEVYCEGFKHNTAHHWSGVQYLALEAVLTGKIANVGHWYACKVAAESDCDHAKTEVDRIWAMGSLAELALLALLDPNLPRNANAATDAIDNLRQRMKQSDPRLFPNLSPIVSTRRQMMRYVTWWTKDNGFFTERQQDLSKEAEALARRLDE